VAIKTQEHFHTDSLIQTPVLFIKTNGKAFVCVAENLAQKLITTLQIIFSQILTNGELSGSVLNITENGIR